MCHYGKLTTISIWFRSKVRQWRLHRDLEDFRSASLHKKTDLERHVFRFGKDVETFSGPGNGDNPRRVSTVVFDISGKSLAGGMDGVQGTTIAPSTVHLLSLWQIWAPLINVVVPVNLQQELPHTRGGELQKRNLHRESPQDRCVQPGVRSRTMDFCPAAKPFGWHAASRVPQEFQRVQQDSQGQTAHTESFYFRTECQRDLSRLRGLERGWCCYAGEESGAVCQLLGFQCGKKIHLRFPSVMMIEDHHWQNALLIVSSR